MNYLKKYRKQAGFSQEEMVERLSVGLTTYKQWEAGRGSPTLEQLRDMDRALQERNVRLPIVEVIDQMMDVNFAEIEGELLAPQRDKPSLERKSTIVPPDQLFEEFEAYGGKADWFNIPEEKKQKLLALHRKCSQREFTLRTFYEAEFFKVLYHENYSPAEEPPF